MSKAPKKFKFRSQHWFDNPDNADMTALYVERYLNYGFTQGEIQGGKPIIGIAQTGSDLSPCNRVHVELVKRVRDGIIAAGGVPFEFPIHPEKTFATFLANNTVKIILVSFFDI